MIAVRRFRLKFPDSFRKEIRKGLLEDQEIQAKCEGVEPEPKNPEEP